MFIRGRHLNISSILITQNLFLADKNFRQISLNITCIVLLRHRDMKQILTFGRSFLPDSKVKQFLSLYTKIIAKGKFNHLLIDFTSDFDSPISIRSSVVNLNEGEYEKAYLL